MFGIHRQHRLLPRSMILLQDSSGLPHSDNPTENIAKHRGEADIIISAPNVKQIHSAF